MDADAVGELVDELWCNSIGTIIIQKSYIFLLLLLFQEISRVWVALAY